MGAKKHSKRTMVSSGIVFLAVMPRATLRRSSECGINFRNVSTRKVDLENEMDFLTHYRKLGWIM